MDCDRISGTARAATRNVAFAAAVLALTACSTRSSEHATLAVPAPDTRASMPGSVCGPTESTIFACTLEPHGDRIALCMDGRSPGQRSYYVRERGGVRAVVPNPGRGADAFTRSFLHYTQGTGGYAFAFNEGGKRRVIYSISGANGFEEQGTFIRPGDQAMPASGHEACRPGTVVEQPDGPGLDAVLKWPADPVNSKHGIPARAKESGQ